MEHKKKISHLSHVHSIEYRGDDAVIDYLTAKNGNIIVQKTSEVRKIIKHVAPELTCDSDTMVEDARALILEYDWAVVYCVGNKLHVMKLDDLDAYRKQYNYYDLFYYKDCKTESKFR